MRQTAAQIAAAMKPQSWFAIVAAATDQMALGAVGASAGQMQRGVAKVVVVVRE